MESLSWTAFSTHTGTPPTAVLRFFTALKSTIMKWSTWMPVICCTVRIVQPGSRPSWPRLSLNRTACWPGMSLTAPSCFVGHTGMLVIRSRGMDNAVALLRSFETWNRIVVSAWPTLFASP